VCTIANKRRFLSLLLPSTQSHFRDFLDGFHLIVIFMVTNENFPSMVYPAVKCDLTMISNNAAAAIASAGSGGAIGGGDGGGGGMGMGLVGGGSSASGSALNGTLRDTFAHYTSGACGTAGLHLYFQVVSLVGMLYIGSLTIAVSGEPGRIGEGALGAISGVATCILKYEYFHRHAVT
jgi:hypothetical protein